ncbi:hypothetical protein, partial [Roseovarius salis]|uniref:hypothetical protein n=1 Tax=Roseovarius salis TaxID=3376063 RepID=UPI0037C93D55
MAKKTSSGKSSSKRGASATGSGRSTEQSGEADQPDSSPEYATTPDESVDVSGTEPVSPDGEGADAATRAEPDQQDAQTAPAEASPAAQEDAEEPDAQESGEDGGEDRSGDETPAADPLQAEREAPAREEAASEPSTAEHDKEDMHDGLHPEDTDTPQSDSADSAWRAEDGRDEVAAEERVTSADQPPAQAPASTERVIERKGGFVPTVLGGAVAAVIGFGAGYYYTSEYAATAPDPAALETLRNDMQSEIETLRGNLQGTLEEQESRISALSDDVAATEPPDISTIRETQSELDDAIGSLTERVSELETRLDDIRARVSEIATRPVREGASDEAIAAYEAELEALQESMARQRAEIEEMAAEARQMEESAAQTERATRRRAALSRVQTAIDTGGGFASALSELEATGMNVPPALTGLAESGVATISDLQESFPAPARAAL